MQYKEEDKIVFLFLDRQWQIYRADMELLWENMVTNAHNSQNYDDEKLPYWAELWPSSFALAHFLEKNKSLIEKQNCLDLGCGLGFTAFCGTVLGAKVLAVDYDDEAILLAKHNATMNNIFFYEKIKDYYEQDQYTLCIYNMDWRKPCIKEKSLPFIWAADIAYEKKFMPEILTFLDFALSSQGVFWIAEPSRTIYQYFIEEVKKFSFNIKKVYTEKTQEINKNILSANVNIWEITRK